MQNEQIILILLICGGCAFFPALLCTIFGLIALARWYQASKNPTMVEKPKRTEKQPRQRLSRKKSKPEQVEEEHIPVASAILSEDTQSALTELLEFMPITPGWQHLYIKEQAR